MGAFFIRVNHFVNRLNSVIRSVNNRAKFLDSESVYRYLHANDVEWLVINYEHSLLTRCNKSPLDRINFINLQANVEALIVKCVDHVHRMLEIIVVIK